MFKKIIKYFRNSPINNEKGSSLSMALIVVAILSFSMTTITGVNVNLAGSTTVKLDQVSNENVAKGLINQAMSDASNLFYSEEIDSDDKIDEFNNTEIPNILDNYGVVVTDVTDEYPEYGTDGDHESRVYKFAFTLNDGKILYKLGFVSNGGTAVENLNPFDFSLATNEQLIMNSGYYDEIQLYGNEVSLASVAPYVKDGTTTQQVTPYSSSNGGTYPVLTPSGTASTVYATTSYEYCASTSTCFDLNSGTTPIGIFESNYIDVDGSSLADQGELAEETISDFFSDFSYEDYTVDFIQNDAPTATRVITDSMTLATAGDVVRNNSEPITYGGGGGGWWGGGGGSTSYPDTAFADVTNDSNIDFTNGVSFTIYSPFYDDDLLITDDVDIDDGYSLFVYGDLTIDNSSSISLEGTIIVTGDLYFTGDSIEVDGTFFVFGETYMQFNDGEGLEKAGTNDGFALLTGDNIIIESMFVSHTSSTQSDLISVFFYTEESIWIDAVNGRINIEGALFARAQGVSGNQIFMNDESNTPVNGIVINSYRGYINNSGIAVPSSYDSRNGFIITPLTRRGFQTKFTDIPTFDTLITNIDNWVFESSEFQYDLSAE